LLLTVLFLYFYNLRKQWLASLFLATAVASKIFPIFLLLLFVMKKEWKWLFVTLINVALLQFSALLITNTQVVFYFFGTVLPDISNSWSLAYHNQSLNAFLGRTFGIEL